MRIGVKSSRSLLPLGGMVEQVEIVRVYAVRIVEGSGQVRFDHVFWSGNKRSPRSVATAPTVRKTRDPFFPFIHSASVAIATIPLYLSNVIFHRIEPFLTQIGLSNQYSLCDLVFSVSSENPELNLQLKSEG